MLIVIVCKTNFIPIITYKLKTSCEKICPS